jgi:hypothetical protein
MRIPTLPESNRFTCRWVQRGRPFVVVLIMTMLARKEAITVQETPFELREVGHGKLLVHSNLRYEC